MFWYGPIPARTGQPLALFVRGNDVGAYPRSHGATFLRAANEAAGRGLSPLARGNLCAWFTDSRPAGPIPARTGQPCMCRAPAGALRAYPRSHGATAAQQAAATGDRGLSPLARGNPCARHGRANALGPIPARTGQPHSDSRTSITDGAYPRSHGATSTSEPGEEQEEGLSPLARGNRVDAKAFCCL